MTPEQRAFVAEPSYYLALCCYGSQGWKPLAILNEEQVIGMVMWAVDPDDGSCWLGGFLIDRREQGKGYGRQALNRALELLGERGFKHFALSYDPQNEVARKLYQSNGFEETGEREGDEVVAQYSLPL